MRHYFDSQRRHWRKNNIFRILLSWFLVSISSTQKKTFRQVYFFQLVEFRNLTSGFFHKDNEYNIESNNTDGNLDLKKYFYHFNIEF